VGVAVTNEIYIQDDTESLLNLGNACHLSVQNL
jgi:hypothetical protein